MAALGWLLNLGFAGGEPADVPVLGPYHVAAAEIFHTGAATHEAFHAGAAASEQFIPGAVTRQTHG